VLGIRWENLVLDTGVLTINGALKRIEGKLIKGKTKKECSNRTIQLPALRVLPDRECDIVVVGGDCGAANDLRSLSTPQLSISSVRSPPNTVTRASRGDIYKVIGPESWRERGSWCQREYRLTAFICQGKRAIFKTSRPSIS
jgi:hypothetical protein